MIQTREGDFRCEEFEAARKKAVTLIKARDRSKIELGQRLAQAGFEAGSIEQVIEYCTACGFLDDNRFASSFIRSKLALGWGEQRIARELECHGINMFDIDGYPEDYTTCSEKDRALALLERRNLPQKNPEQKLYRYLLSKGFAGETAYTAVMCHLKDLKAC